MKVWNIALLGILICLPVLTSAQFTGGSSEGSVTTVQELKEQAGLDSSGGLLALAAAAEKLDDKTFVMEGNIVTQVEDNVYQFKDETGSINVEIRDFGGVKVAPADRVRLFGEADLEESGLILEVDRLELVK